MGKLHYSMPQLHTHASVHCNYYIVLEYGTAIIYPVERTLTLKKLNIVQLCVWL